jgi:hypothetical protein
VEAVRRSGESDAEIKWTLRGDAQASVRPPGGDTESQSESSLAWADTVQ